MRADNERARRKIVFFTAQAVQVMIRSRSTTDFSRARSRGAVLTKLSPRLRDNIKVHMWAYLHTDTQF